jgi:hypothetical protein
MEANNLNPFAYGFICHDEWNEQTTVDPETEETIVAVEAGDRYSFRYDQLSLFIAKGQEERLNEMQSNFESRLQALENKE